MNENVPLGKTINDTPEGGNGFKYWKNYVLGMNPNDPNSYPIIKGVQNADPEKRCDILAAPCLSQGTPPQHGAAVVFEGDGGFGAVGVFAH